MLKDKSFVLSYGLCAKFDSKLCGYFQFLKQKMFFQFYKFWFSTNKSTLQGHKPQMTASPSR